jgi:hypothetical protein
MGNPNSYIASIEEVIVFLRDLKHVVSSEDCELDILSKKKDEDDSDPYTTANTMLDLDYDTDDVKNEILSLSEKDYIETIKDNKDTNRPPFWVFGKEIKKRDVYIKVKIRNKRTNKVFCISFHYARFPLKNKPYYVNTGLQ